MDPAQDCIVKLDTPVRSQGQYSLKIFQLSQEYNYQSIVDIKTYRCAHSHLDMHFRRTKRLKRQSTIACDLHTQRLDADFLCSVLAPTLGNGFAIVPTLASCVFLHTVSHNALSSPDSCSNTSWGTGDNEQWHWGKLGGPFAIPPHTLVNYPATQHEALLPHVKHLLKPSQSELSYYKTSSSLVSHPIRLPRIVPENWTRLSWNLTVLLRWLI
jgi:hypothetical protein